MSQPQGTIDTAQADKISQIQSNIQDLQSIYFAEETPEQDKPFIRSTILQAQLAVASAQQGQPVDLTQFMSLESMLRGGVEREMRVQQTQNIFDLQTSVADEINQIDIQLLTEVLSPEQRQNLESDKQNLQQQLAYLQQPIANLMQGETEKPSRELLAARQMTPEAQVALDKAVYDAEYIRNIEQGMDLEEAAAQARATARQLNEPLVLDPSGKRSLAAQMVRPAQGVNFATGEIYDPELGQMRPMTEVEKFSMAFRPQVLGVRGDTGRVFTAQEFREQRRPFESISKLRQPETILRDIEPSDIAEAGRTPPNVFSPRVMTEAERDILVESPMMVGARVMGAVPSVATGLVADALTYTVDEQGNPIDPNDFAYKMSDYGAFGLMKDYAPALNFFQPVKSPRAWANATTTTNAAAAALAEGLMFYEIKKAAPAMNIDMQWYQDKYAAGELSAADFALVAPYYLGDTALGGAALVADVLMPLDPLAYVGAPAKVARTTVRLGTKPLYEVVSFLSDASKLPKESLIFKPATAETIARTSQQIQNALMRLERLETTAILPYLYEKLRGGQATRTYRYELNEVVDNALQGGYKSNVRGATISSVQENASREVAANLTDLQMARMYDDAVATSNRQPFTRQVLDTGYAEWLKAARDPDNPLRGAIAVSDEIVHDIRVMRQGGTIPKASIYGSAFRSNLMRAGVKKGRYRKQLIEGYRTNNPDVVPDDFYRVLVNDADIVEEAMNKTIKDMLKDELFARLPVNQIMVGGNRIINIGHWTRKNQQDVANMFQRLTAVDNEGRFIADKNEIIDAFISGIGLDEMRSSKGLQDIIRKIDKGEKLTADQYRIFESGIMGHAWDTVVAESRQPILMTQTAYIEAAEMRSNSVANARARALAVKYTQRIKQEARSTKESVIGTISPKTLLRSRKRLIEQGEDVVSNRAYLATVKIADPAISKTPKPYLDLQYRVNNLRSTAFNDLLDDMERLMRIHKDGTVAMNELIIGASQQQIKVQYGLAQTRFDREYAHLLKSLDEEEALQVAFERSIKEIVDKEQYNSFLNGIETPSLEQIPQLLHSAVKEETIYKLLLRFNENIWFVPYTKGFKDASFQRILRNAASKTVQEGGDINTALLQQTTADLIEANPNLEKYQLRTVKEYKTTETELAWAEAYNIFTLSLRGEVMMKAGIDELLLLYPSMYIDLVLSPIQKLNKTISPKLLVQNTFDALAEVDKNPLFMALKDKQLQESFRRSLAGEKFADQPPNLQKAKEQFEDFLARTYTKRPAGIPAEKWNPKLYRERIFRAARELFKTVENGAPEILLMTSKDLSGFSTRMIQGMVNAKVANKGAAYSLINLVDKSDYARVYSAFDSALKEVFKAADIYARAFPKHKRGGMSSLFGMNGSYTGNVADLRLNILDTANESIGVAPLVFIEKEIDNALRSYGVTIGPSTTNRAAAEVIEMYRPYLEILDTEGVALMMGREMQAEFEGLVNKARGDEWMDILGNYRTITEAYVKGPEAVKAASYAYIGNNFFDILTRISTTGLLGGYFRPNTRYLGVNFFSAPLIMAQELGVLGTLKSLMWLQADHIFIRGNWNPDKVFMVTKNGQTITYGQYAKILGDENIATTFSASQFQKTSMSELLRELALTSDFQQAAKSKQFVRWFLDPSKRTMYTMWSHYSDMRLRRAVFSEALYEGLTPQQAAVRSRESLLDYGKARGTALEKLGGHTIAFWSFQWMSMKSLVGSLWRGKGDAVRLIRAQEGYNKQQETYYVGNTREHARIFRYFTEKGRERNVEVGGFYNPAYESLGIVIDGMSIIGAGAAVATTETSLTYRELIDRTTRAILERKPWLPLVGSALVLFDSYMGVGKRNPYQGTRFLPPMYIPLMEADPYFAQELKYYFDLEDVSIGSITGIKDLVEPVAPREFDPTYNGKSYRFKTKSAEIQFFELEQLMFAAGLLRRTQDDIKMFYSSNMAGADDLTFDRGYYKGIQQLYMQAGMSSPMGLQMSAAVSYELGLISMLREDTPEALFIRAELQRQMKKESMKTTK